MQSESRVGDRDRQPPAAPQSPAADARPESWNALARQQLLDVFPDPVVMIDGAGRIVRLNAATEEAFGYARSTLLGQPVETLLPERFRERHVGLRNGFFAAPHKATLNRGLDLVARRENGTEFSVEVSLNPVWEDGQLLVTCVIRDVTERERREALLRKAEARYRTLVETIPAVTFVATVDGQQSERYVSPQIEKLLGYSQEEWLERPALWHERLHPEDRDCWEHEFARVWETGSDFNSEYRFLTKTGRVVWVHGVAKMVHDEHGAPQMLHGIAFDITHRKEAELILHRSREELESRVRERTHELAQAALIDKLTGLPNRWLLLERLQHTMDRAHLTGVPFAVMFLDFDRFKIINDSLGHDVGDAFLCQIAERLRRLLRASDSVSRQISGPSAARLGGDEFVVLLDAMGHPDDATRVAERLLDAFSQPYYLGSHEVFSTASIGIVIGSDAYTRAEDILRDADTAMYEAKRGGKARYVVFDEAMRKRVLRRLKLETDLRRAIDEQQFYLVYQPIVSLTTGEIKSVEALLRWRHPTEGLVSPGEFVPIAEESDLILHIGDWVLREGVRQMTDWVQRLGEAAPPTISLNLSRKQFIRSDLPEQIRAVAQAAGLAAERIQFEITEDTFASDVQAAIAAMNAIKRLGCTLAIDDFGTGCSSFASLHEFPADVLKIDRSLLKGIEESKDTAALVHSLAILVRNLGMTMVAEGVETETNVISLRDLGCQYGQGYYFAKPLVPADFEAYATHHRATGGTIVGAAAFQDRWSQLLRMSLPWIEDGGGV
jgi:diguanylate cyclase (GGDEF)-like protein/PAS domain S-box-containing protein